MYKEEFTCPRCLKRSSSWTMSLFNTQDICLECKNKEEQHPDYKEALRKDIEEINNGNFNFKGIGKPVDL
jgi:hypothetical protein